MKKVLIISASPRKGGSIERGVIYGTGAYAKGEVRNLPAMREAYEAGLGV